MSETSDPYEALASKQVRDQAAGARDLARTGSWDDMPLLVDKATHSKSAAVRLYTAAAAGDIVHRMRLSGALERSHERQILDWVSAANPDLSAGLLLLMSAVTDSRALDRIGRFLRDPRNGVRAGAVATLRRMVLSRTARDTTDVAGRAADWLAHTKLPPDTALDLVHIVGEVGWTELGPAIQRHASHSDRHEEAVSTALVRLEKRLQIDGWAGLYRDLGADVFELTETDVTGAPTWLALGRTGECRQDGEPIEGRIGHFDGEDARIIWAPPMGSPDERLRVIQTDTRSYWEVPRSDIVNLLSDDPEQFPTLPPRMPDLLVGLEGPTVPRVTALWSWIAGDLDAARAGLDALTGKAKSPHALYYWLARVAEDQGDVEAACLAAGIYMDKAKKTDPIRARADALIERLAAHT